MIDCRDCKEYGYLTKKCDKKYKIKFIDGCEKCGIPYNYKVWCSDHGGFNRNNCIDFERRYFSDPSGS